MKKICLFCKWRIVNWNTGYGGRAYCNSSQTDSEDVQKYLREGKEGCPFFERSPDVRVVEIMESKGVIK